MPSYSRAYAVYGIPDCHLFENKIMTILNMHVSLKMKIIKADTTPYLSKVIRKGIMSRSAVEENYSKTKWSVFQTKPKKVNG